MKALQLEFTFFDGSKWNDVTVSITAFNRFQLIRHFIYETSAIHEAHNRMNEKEQRKALWNEYKGDIEEIAFPVVNKWSHTKPY